MLIQDVDRVRWKQELQEDEELLVRLLREAREIEAARDEKLHRLKELIAEKCRQPINPGNTKVIVFTAFADTAEYLYENIAGWARHELGLHSAIVTGRHGQQQDHHAESAQGPRFHHHVLLAAVEGTRPRLTRRSPTKSAS